MTYSPASFVTVSRVPPVPVLVNATFAAGMTALSESRTVPRMVLIPVWPHKVQAIRRKQAAAIHNFT
jgi:hypothetical protein